MVLRKVVLSQIVIMMLASCGANSGGGGISKEMMLFGQNANMRAENFSHAKKQDIPIQVIPLSDSIEEINFDEILVKTPVSEGAMPLFESTRKVGDKESRFNYKGDRDIRASFADSEFGNSDFSTGSGTLYIHTSKDLRFDSGSEINIHLTGKGGVLLDNDSFHYAKIHLITEWLDKSIKIKDAYQESILMRERLSKLFEYCEYSEYIKTLNDINFFSQTIRSAMSPNELIEKLKNGIEKARSIFDKIDEFELKYKGEDPVIARPYLLAQMKQSIPLVQSIISILSDTSLTAGLASNGGLQQAIDRLASVADKIKPLLQMKAARDLYIGSTIKIDNLAPIHKQTFYKIMDLSASGKIQNETKFSTKGLKVFGQNGNYDIENTDLAEITIGDINNSYVFLLTLRDIGMSGSPFLARSSTPSFLRASSGGSVDHFVGSLYTGVSLDANAQTFKMGNMMMSASSDSLNRLDNFVGFSYQNTPSQTFGMYAKYNLAQKAQIDNFAVYTMSSAKGFRVFNTLSYAGLNDKNEGLLLSSQSQTLVLKSQVSHDFTVSNLTFTPKVFAGYGQLLSHNVTKDFEKFDVSTDTSSVFMGAGFDVSSGFKVAGVPVHAFGSMEVSCDALQRNTRIGSNNYAISDSNKSLSLGVKADLSKESSLYTTTKLQDNNAQISHGFEIGLNVKI